MSTSRDAYRALKAPSPPAPPESPPAAPARQSPKAAITPSTHTYRLFTLLKSVRPAGFCQTDAKRRDCTTFRREVKGKCSVPQDIRHQRPRDHCPKARSTRRSWIRPMKLFDTFRSPAGQIDFVKVGRALAAAGTTDLYFAGGFDAILQGCRQILQLPRWKFRSGTIIVVSARQNIHGMEHASSETRKVTGPAGSTFK